MPLRSALLPLLASLALAQGARAGTLLGTGKALHFGEYWSSKGGWRFRFSEVNPRDHPLRLEILDPQGRVRWSALTGRILLNRWWDEQLVGHPSLNLQGDGNLCVYRPLDSNAPRSPDPALAWATFSRSPNPCQLLLEDDGTFHIREAKGREVWKISFRSDPSVKP